MRPDNEIRTDVENELRWDADIDATDIGVTVNEAVVVLTGFARSYSQKWEAERDARRVVGVVGVANDIEVRLPALAERTDPEIARDAATALRLQLPYLADTVKVAVSDGRLTLEGAVEWQHHRQRAENAVRRIRGVKHLVNALEVKPRRAIADVKHRIEDAFRRSAEIDASGINVKIEGGAVLLEGEVRTWAEREEAERAAWFAPGVTSVKNRIAIRH